MVLSLSLTCDFGSPGPPAALSGLTTLTRLRLDAMPAQRGWQRRQEVGPALAATHPGLLQLQLEGRLKVSRDVHDEAGQEGDGPPPGHGHGHGGGPPALLDDFAGFAGLGLGGAGAGGPPGPDVAGAGDAPPPPQLLLGAAAAHIPFQAAGDGDIPPLMQVPPLMATGSSSDDGGPPSLGGSAGSEASDDGGPPGLQFGAEPSESDGSEDDGPPGLAGDPFLGAPPGAAHWHWPPQRALARQLWDRWQRLETLKLSGCTFVHLAGEHTSSFRAGFNREPRGRLGSVTLGLRRVWWLRSDCLTALTWFYPLTPASAAALQSCGGCRA